LLSMRSARVGVDRMQLGDDRQMRHADLLLKHTNAATERARTQLRHQPVEQRVVPRSIGVELLDNAQPLGVTHVVGSAHSCSRRLVCSISRRTQLIVLRKYSAFSTLLLMLTLPLVLENIGRPLRPRQMRQLHSGSGEIGVEISSWHSRRLAGVVFSLLRASAPCMNSAMRSASFRFRSDDRRAICSNVGAICLNKQRSPPTASDMCSQ
jgi:hypothetical protein